MAEIRPATDDDVATIARLHAEAFPDAPGSRLGLRFLSELYRGYLDHDDTILLVAEVGTKALGFGLASSVATETAVARRNESSAARRVALRPWLLLDGEMGKKVLRRIRPRKPAVAPAASSPAAVDPTRMKVINVGVASDGRGQGIGRSVVEALTSACTERGAGSIFATVARDNDASRAMFRSAGWDEVGPTTFERHPTAG